jgi:Mce-associated membrane protein
VAGARRRSADERVVTLPDAPELTELTELTDSTQRPAVAARPEVLSSADTPLEPITEPIARPTAERTGVRRRRPPLVPALLATCLAAVLAACVLAGVTTRQDRADVVAGTAALAAARSSAGTILSYDYRHLPADFAAASALTTGSFRADYQATTAKAVSQLAAQTKAVVVAKVAAAGVVSSSADRATVLLFVDQTTTSNRLDSAKVDQVRVQLTMTKVRGHWLVSALTAL